jgi:SRSO17 transposase
MLSHGTKSPILSEEEVGVIVHVHMKHKHENCNKANNSNEKAKMGLFQMDSVLELNNKNLGNSSGFLTITHTTLSTNRFRSYGILTIDVAAEFCFWIEQRLDGS